MCTAINERCTRHIFGRTLDLECSLGERVVITPRRAPLEFLHLPKKNEHPAIIGAAHLTSSAALYYDAMNEEGLCAAALSFPLECKYLPPTSSAGELASFEVIPYLLSNAASVSEARDLLSGKRITNESFSSDLPPTPLHWIFADKSSAITVEQTEDGLKIHDNPIGVLSNSPNFSAQIANLERYAHIIMGGEEIRGLHSRGLCGFGIPGDFSSGSRFVRAVYNKKTARAEQEKTAALTRFFHLLDTVAQPLGATHTEDGRLVSTVYSSAMDVDSLEYCFTTYDDRRIRRVKLMGARMDGDRPISYPMHAPEDICNLN